VATILTVNQRVQNVDAAPDTPLLYVLSNNLELQGPRFGCGLAQCGSCSVLVDGVEIRSCVTPLSAVAGKSVTTLEGLPVWYAQQKKLASAPELHPLQQAVIDEQALQCGYCYNGQIVPVRYVSPHHQSDPAQQGRRIPLTELDIPEEDRRRGIRGPPRLIDALAFVPPWFGDLPVST